MADNTPNDIAEHFVELREFVGAGFARGRTELKSEISGLRAEMHSGFARIDERFDRLESKIDAFITVQSQINRELLDR